MTKLDPITSEEVLARQVKEQAKLRPAPNVSRRENASSSPASSSAQLSPAAPAEKQVQSSSAESIVQSGFVYRMPLGSYLLSFLYLQVCVAVACIIVFNIVTSVLSDHTLSQALFTVQRETWGVLVISIVFSFFIFSGNNILRLLTIAGSALLALILGYNLVSAVVSFSNASSAASIVSLLVMPYVAAVTLGIALFITTIVYLMRKKISHAYN